MPREPIDLTRWKLVLHKGRHGTGYRLVGYDRHGGSPRISSQVVQIDPGLRRAATKTGRTYCLVGPPGWGLRELGILGFWQQRYGVSDEDLVIGVSLEKAAQDLTPPPASRPL